MTMVHPPVETRAIPQYARVRTNQNAGEEMERKVRRVGITTTPIIDTTGTTEDFYQLQINPGAGRQHCETHSKREKMKSRNQTEKTTNINIFTYNLNFFGHRFKNYEFANFLEDKSSENFHIMGFAERNINWHSETVYRDIATIFKSVYIKGKLPTATSPIFIPNKYKSGGIMIGLSRRILSKRQDHGTDKYGRWAWTRFEWTKGVSLLYLQLYLPDSNYGLCTSTTQKLQATLRDSPNQTPNIRKQFE